MQKAFTMAEVLITLGIIGIVAAMTLPALINNSRNKQLEEGLKRSYSVLSQALDMYYAQTGEKIKPGNIGLHELKPALMKYLNTVQDCGFGTSDAYEACIPNTGGGNYTDRENLIQYKTYNGKQNVQMRFFDDGQFVLNDGSLVLLENNSPEMTGNLFISVDINGYNKNPNRLGVDLFMFQIDDKGTLLPMGVKGTAYYSETDANCSPSSESAINGAGCTYKALTDKNFFRNIK